MKKTIHRQDNKKNPLVTRTHIQGRASYVRPAELTARTVNVRAVMRHFVPIREFPLKDGCI